MNFGGISPEFTSFDDAEFVVIPVPYDLTSTYQSGSRRGPHAILEASREMELYDNELDKETCLSGIHTIPPLEVDARGPKEMIDTVRRKITELIFYNKTPVILGGEHSITIGAVQAVKEKYPSISVLHLDAHADMRDSYQGSPYSHACVGRRIFEICPVVQFGIRSMSIEESVFIKENGVRTYSPDFIDETPDWIQRICEHLSEDVYLSVDLDVLDPSVMPATGTPEPGGIYWKDLIRLISEVSKVCTIRGADIVELSPIPGMVAPDFTAAKLTYKIMGYIDSKE